ncbi:hypothetical protein SAMN05720470_1084 [Fibrobacter sp. UWOV1]|uniref:hypothetical protein n=1 Tax=Fibrobacter sp. UWOV1 TaxID=1896215 RepID=UPI00091062C5|nr:hypothetical protein [Fibrobacter sp. UWOV1]SHL40825.1 hypothetical protein SAMN05720470_1084 [Fibrobacter sp. UWOV1]
MRPVAYVNLPIAEFREKVNEFGKDYEAIGKWVLSFSKTLAMMGTNEPKDDFALRLLNEVETWRKGKADKMRQLREERKENKSKPDVYERVAEVVTEKPAVKVKKKLFGMLQNVSYTEDEEMKLREKLGVRFDRAVEILSNYKASSGKRYKSDYAATLNWVIDRVEEETRKNVSSMSQAQRLAIGMLGGANG